MPFSTVRGWEVTAPFYRQRDLQRKGPCVPPMGVDVQTTMRRLSGVSGVPRPRWLWWSWLASEGMALCG